MLMRGHQQAQHSRLWLLVLLKSRICSIKAWVTVRVQELVNCAHLEVLDHVDGDVQGDGDERRVQDDEGQEAEQADQGLVRGVEQPTVVGALPGRAQLQVPVVLRTERST